MARPVLTGSYQNTVQNAGDLNDPETISFTLAPDADILLVGVSIGYPAGTLPSVTWKGASMTLFEASNAGSNRGDVWLFYIVRGATGWSTGTGNIVISDDAGNFGGGANGVVSAAGYRRVNIDAPFAPHVAGNEGSGTGNASLSVTATVNDLVLEFLSCERGTTASTITKTGATRTNRTSVDGTAFLHSEVRVEEADGTGGALTLSWTLAFADSRGWNQLAVVLQGAVASGGSGRAPSVGESYEALVTGVWNGSTFVSTHAVTTLPGQSVLVVRLSGSATVPTSMTFNGVALTLIMDVADGNVSRVQIWELVNPPTGAYNLSWTLGSERTYRICANGLWNVMAQTRRAGGSESSFATNSGCSVATLPGDLVLDVAHHDTGAWSGAGAGQDVQVNSSDGNTRFAAMSSKLATSLSTSTSWTGTASSWQASASVSYAPIRWPSNGTILRGATTTHDNNASPNFNVTIPSGNNRVALYTLALEYTSGGPPTSVTVTVGGVSMVALGSVVTHDDAVGVAALYTFYLLNASFPGTGTQSVAPTVTGGTGVQGRAQTFRVLSDAKQAAPTRYTASGDVQNIILPSSGTAAIQRGGYALAATSANGVNAFTPSSGWTEDFDFQDSAGDDRTAGAYLESDRDQFTTVTLSRATSNIRQAAALIVIDPYLSAPGGCAKVMVVDLPNLPTDGTFSVQGVGFAPKAIIVFGQHYVTATAPIQSHAQSSVGFASAAPTLQQRAHYSYARDGQTTSNTAGADCSDIAVFGFVRANNGDRWRIAVASFDSDGVTFKALDNFAQITQRIRLSILFLGGDALTDAVAGSDQITSGVQGNTYSVTTLAFQPDFILFNSCHQSGGGFAQNRSDGGQSLGWAKSSTDRGCVGLYSENGNVAGSNSAKVIRTDACVALPAFDASADIKDLDFVSMNSNGFSVIADVFTGSTSYWYMYLALKGMSVAIGTVGMPTTVGIQSAVTGLAFAPSAVVFASVFGGTVALTVPVVDAELSLGMAARDRGGKIDQAAQYNLDPDALATTDAIQRFGPGRVLWNGQRDAADTFTPTSAASLAEFTNDGFKLYGDDADATAHLALYAAFGPWVGDDSPSRAREPWSVAVSFRATTEYVSDEEELYDIGGVYPVTRYWKGRAVTFGWDVAPSTMADNANTGDRRIAGSARADDSFTRNWRLDLPHPGLFEVELVRGRWTNSQASAGHYSLRDNDAAMFQILDDNAPLQTGGALGDIIGGWHLGSSWPQYGAGRTVRVLTRTNILNVRITGVTAGAHIAYIRVRHIPQAG